VPQENELTFDEALEEEEEQLGPLITNRKIYTKQADAEVDGLYRKHQRNKLIVQPDFQRHFIWDGKKASRLIESAILDIPIPSIYLAEEQDGREYVIDGQQRLISFFSFIDGKFPDGKEFRLTGLKVLQELNTRSFKELDQHMQDKILYYKSRVITFTSESDEQLKFEVFERLNTGSVSLNNQELRNCIYHGPYIDLLRELSKEEDFRYLLGLHDPEKRMDDIELVARFAAFYHVTYLKYKPPMKDFIDNDIRMYRHLSDKDARALRSAFKTAISTIKSIFDKSAFKRYLRGDGDDHNGKWLARQFNKGLYDILMYTFAKTPKNRVYNHLDAIRESLLDLMTHDDSFINAIDKSTGSSEMVLTRFKIWEEHFEHLIGSTKEPRCFSSKLKEEIYRADPSCMICEQRIQTIDDAALDHIHQYWMGGKTIPENARLTHRYCNWSRSKSNRVEIIHVPEKTETRVHSRTLFLGNDRYPCKYAWEILFNTAEWLIQRNLLKAHDFPIQFPGSKRYLVNNNPLHANGKEFFAPKPLSNGLYIEVHAGTEQLLNNTYRLLEKFGVSRDRLSIEEDMKNAVS